MLDTGLKTQGLSDYDGQVVSGWNVLKGSSDTSSSAGNHGTYVAGVVGLVLGNGVGNVGYCPDCRVMPVQVGTDSGAYLSDLATGLTWAADHGARVANMSWAGTASSTTLTSAVSYARSKGVVVGSTLRVAVTASNGSSSASALSAATAIVVAVSPLPAGPTNQTVVFSGSLNQKNLSRTFSVSVGAGTAHAALSFSKCSSMRLDVSNGANATGLSVVTLDTTLTAGTYSYTVSGGRCSFTLTVTAPAG